MTQAPPSRASYRLSMRRTSQAPPGPGGPGRKSSRVAPQGCPADAGRRGKETGLTILPEEEHEVDPTVVLFNFASARYAVLENSSFVAVRVVRSGPVDTKAKVGFKTVDGTAVS